MTRLTTEMIDLAVLVCGQRRVFKFLTWTHLDRSPLSTAPLRVQGRYAELEARIVHHLAHKEKAQRGATRRPWYVHLTFIVTSSSNPTASVVESRVRRKKSRGGVGVFQYAQTVEKDVWQDTQQQLDLRVRLCSGTPSQSSNVSLRTKYLDSPRNFLKLPQSIRRPRYLRLLSVAIPRTNQHVDTRSSSNSFPSQTQMTCHSPNCTFRTHHYSFRPIHILVPSFRPGIAESVAPPSGVAGLKMYSAVLSTDGVSEHEVDPEVEKFLPLLTEYLKSGLSLLHSNHTITVHYLSVNDAEPTSRYESTNQESSGDVDDSDYVWDVFYHRPTTLSEWNQVANIGTLYVLRCFTSCVCCC